MTSKWREKYKVHPAADVFPEMSDDELQKLGSDIQKHGLREPVIFQVRPERLIDGRNPMEAMERVGLNGSAKVIYLGQDKDPVAFIISKNIHRRHLTKQQQADLIVAAIKAGEKPRSDCAVSKGGRGKVNPTRQKAIAEGKKANIGERAMQAAVAKAEGRKPKKKPWRRTPVHSGLDAARRAYFKWCIDLDADLDAELDIIREAFREIAGKRAMDKNPPPTPLETYIAERQGTTLPADGDSESGLDHSTSESSDDFPEMPGYLVRRM
jgi:hypothetical protein